MTVARIPVCHGHGVVHVIAEHPGSLHEELDHAVEQLRESATAADRRGILVTRWSQSLFTVEASARVPYGVTLEEDRWHRQPAAPPAAAGNGAGG